MRHRIAAATAAIAVAGGCGPSAAPRPAPERGGGGVLVAALGDSITAGTPFHDPYAPAGERGDEGSPWTAAAQRRLPATRFRNCGVNGERTDEIARRLNECAAGAKVLVIQGGINDLAQGRPVEAAARHLRAMVRRGHALRLRVGIVEVLPWNNGYPSAAPLIDALNRAIRSIARDEGATLSAWHRVLEDPAARGRMRSSLTVEGDHPTRAGYALLGDAFAMP